MNNFVKGYYITVSWTWVGINIEECSVWLNGLHLWIVGSLRYIGWKVFQHNTSFTEAYCFVTSSLEMVCFVALIDSLIMALWWPETKFQYDKQSRAKEWISERWSCASNYHHACEIPFTIRAGLQLNMSARQSLYLCNVVWTERNSLYFFSVDSLCLSQCQTAHPQTTHNPFTDCLILRMNMKWIIPQ